MSRIIIQRPPYVCIDARLLYETSCRRFYLQCCVKASETVYYYRNTVAQYYSCQVYVKEYDC